MVVGAWGIAKCRDVGFGDESGWVRVEIRRVDSDGALVFLPDHGNSVKLPVGSSLSSTVCVIPRFVRDYPPQAHPCRLRNPSNERLLWSPGQSNHFARLLRLKDYVLYVGEDLRKISPPLKGNSAVVKIVDFYFELAEGVWKSVAETIEYLDKSPTVQPLPVQPLPSSPPLTPYTGIWTCRFIT